MICKNCGNEIEQGKIYCDYCGKAVQIVPDYNILDEEILPGIVEDPKLKEKREEKRRLEKELKEKEEKIKSAKDTGNGNRKKKKRKNKRLFILLMILGILVLIEIIFLFIHNYRTSYGYYMEKAKISDMAEDYDTAADYYGLALLKSPGDKEATLSVAEDRYRLKDYEGAEEAYLSYIASDPYDPDAYRGLLNVYGALNEYDKILSLKENSPDEIKTLFKDFVLSTVSFMFEGGSYTDDVYIVLNTDDEDLSIYYTTDGTDPSKNNGEIYTEPFIITDGETTVKAVCVDSSGHTGRIRTEVYKVTYQAPEPPVVAPRSGIYENPTKINMSAGEYCTIYYTWDQTMPGVASEIYISPIDMPEGNNILSVIAIDKHGLSSSVVKYNYEYMP